MLLYKKELSMRLLDPTFQDLAVLGLVKSHQLFSLCICKINCLIDSWSLVWSPH